MSRPTVPTCDECGAHKKETNHWWILIPESNSQAIHIYRYHESITTAAHVAMSDLCSEQCVTRAIGKWMRGELRASPAANFPSAPRETPGPK